MSRVVNLERLKKLYATFSIPQLLTDYGISDNQLVPPRVDTCFDLVETDNEPLTPLWYYDNIDFDSRNADEWVKKDINGVSLPVSAIVYLPTSSDEEFPRNYNWTDANVIEYNLKSKIYSVVVFNNNSTKEYPGIHRIQIHFKGEDPREFVKRIKYAIVRREYCENIYKWSMHLNNFIVVNQTKYATESLPDEFLEKTLIRIFNTQKSIKMNIGNFVIEEINKRYQESCLSFRLQFLKSAFKDNYKTLKIPDFGFEHFRKKAARISTVMVNYTTMREEFNKNKLTVIPEVITALQDCNKDNILIKDKRLLSTNFPNTVTLKEFETIQIKNILEIFNYLKDHWIKEVTFKCYAALKNIKTGWFDISTSNIEVYESSINKLRKLLTLIQYMMQECLQMIVLNSVRGYARLIEQPCIPIKGINGDFAWGDNLNKSPFDEHVPPLFSIILNMNANGPYYSVDLDTFEPVIINLLKRVIVESHQIPAIQPYLLTNMMFCEKSYLTSIGLVEDKITEQQTIIENSIRSAIIPLKSYCKKFNIHLPLFNTDVKPYVKEFFDGNPSLMKIKAEISMQIKMKLNLEQTFPESIHIGLFLVNIKPLKNVLIKKRIELANLIMETHATLTTEKIEICCSEYKTIYLRLIEIPTSIEQVFETREWIDTLPTEISNQSDIIKRLFKDMEMLDSFLFIIDEDQLKLKFDSQIWPYKIELRIKESLESIAVNIEKFEKAHFEDELLLQDNVEYLSSVILKLTIENNLSKVLEIAVEVNKNWKLIQDLQLTSQTLNLRQKLFGHTVTPFENVKQLVDEFEPYKILWLSASEFLKLQNAWLQNPLTNVERSILDPSISNLLNIVTKSIEQFAEIPGTLSVAIEIKSLIEEYMPTVQLLKYILTQGMKQRHWDIFYDKTGVKVILTPSLNLKKCLAMGVDKYVEEIQQISENAAKEYEIEIVLNTMINEWNGVKLQLMPYNDSDNNISTISDKELQMLDDHILVTQQLTSGSFTGIFEEPLVKWQDNIKLTKLVLGEWREFQKKWIYLNAMFDNPDIKDELPTENKKLGLVERTWKRIMKITINKPWVMKTCPDILLLEKLVNANIQLNKIQKTLSDYLQTNEPVVQ